MRLEYYNPSIEDEASPLHDGRALRGAVCGTVAAVLAIAMGLIELDPLTRRGMLMGVAVIGAVGIAYAAHALLTHDEHVERALGVAGAALGGLSIFAAFVLF